MSLFCSRSSNGPISQRKSRSLRDSPGDATHCCPIASMSWPPLTPLQPWGPPCSPHLLHWFTSGPLHLLLFMPAVLSQVRCACSVSLGLDSVFTSKAFHNHHIENMLPSEHLFSSDVCFIYMFISPCHKYKPHDFWGLVIGAWGFCILRSPQCLQQCLAYKGCSVNNCWLN